jgi:protoporphyrinogen oxidase
VTAPPFVSILGGGPAGLAAGYFARQRGWSSQIFEAGDRVGGNCATIEIGPFRFDLGAHRFHDKDPEITAIVRSLLGNELQRVVAGSAISLDGAFLPFPPTARELLAHLGPRRFIAAAIGTVGARMVLPSQATSLDSLARRAYGPALAKQFLLNYSEKLWGVPCTELSPKTSGSRLNGLGLRSLFKRAVASGAHLEGAFYYPAGGYGRIATRLADACGTSVIKTRSSVTQLFHDGRQITAVEINHRDRVPVRHVVMTLPLNVAAGLFNPPLEDDIRAAATQIRFRNLLLVMWLLDRPSLTSYATIYFPDRATPFTRAYEPRNRSAAMAPAGQTSLVVEIPCNADDEVWNADEQMVIAQAEAALRPFRWIAKNEVIGSRRVRVRHAYPVLTNDAERRASLVASRLARFSNLQLIGRNGTFEYGWLHTMLRMAKTAVDDLALRTVSDSSLLVQTD